MITKAVPAIGLMAAALLLGPSASAQPTASDKAAAEALFDEAKGHVERGEYADAIKKFEASQRLDAGIGTMLYLADAYEKVGRTASAWATFREAAATAKTAGQVERERVARARASALEPKLFKLTISATETDIPGLEVRRNGTIVGKGLWGTGVPLDPGAYLIEASAPAKRSWSTTVNVPQSAGTQSVTIPALEDLPNAASPASPAGPPTAAESPATAPAPIGKTEVPPSGMNGMRIAGIVLGVAGVATLGVAGAFTARALSKDGEADEHCSGAVCRDTEGQQLSEDARAAGNVSTVLLVAGGLAVAGGVVLIVAAPPSDSGARTALVRVAPTVGPQHAGFMMGGHW